MKLILSFAATAALAGVAACSPTNQDNAAANLDSNSGGPEGGSVLPIDDNQATADTLGNQLDQLNRSENPEESAVSAGNSVGNAD